MIIKVNDNGTIKQVNIPTSVVTSVNGQTGDVTISAGSPDWNANYGEAGYIENRTHYKEYEDVEDIIPQQTVGATMSSPGSLTVSEGVTYYTAAELQNFLQNCGTVKINRDEYTNFTAQIYGDTVGVTCGLSNDYYISIPIDGSNATLRVMAGGSFTVRVILDFSTYKTLDTKYLPMDVLQTSAITDTGNYFTTDTVEDALQELGATVNGIETLLAEI